MEKKRKTFEMSNAKVVYVKKITNSLPKSFPYINIVNTYIYINICGKPLIVELPNIILDTIYI